MTTDNFHESVRSEYAKLIHAAVDSAQSGVANILLERGLEHSAENGWVELVLVIRNIIRGDRRRDQLEILQDQDLIIASSILDGIENPTSLPDIASPPQKASAIPRIALLIHAERGGQSSATELLDMMMTQWQSSQTESLESLATCVNCLRRDSQATEIEMEQEIEKLSDRGAQLLRQLKQELLQLALTENNDNGD